MKTYYRISGIILFVIVLIFSSCYVYTNPWDPLADKSKLDVNSVTVVYNAGAADYKYITVDWANVEEADQEDNYPYRFIAAKTSDGFSYDDFFNRDRSLFETSWGERDWQNWSDFYFRIGYRFDGGTVWSEVFHYPMDPYNPMDEGITLTTSPMLEWAEVEWASGYDVEYGKSIGEINGEPEAQAAEASCLCSGLSLAVGDTVYWRVRVNSRSDDKVVHHLWGRTSSFTVKAAPDLGDRYAGGLVFYLDGGGNGMTVTDTKVASDVKWGPALDIAGDNAAAAPELTALGTGQTDSAAIISGIGANGGEPYAAQICADLLYRGFDDWFLPSRDELDEIDTNLQDLAYEYSEGVSSGPGLWTSSEYDAGNAYVYHDGSFYTRYKDGLHNVLAVRNFIY